MSRRPSPPCASLASFPAFPSFLIALLLLALAASAGAANVVPGTFIGGSESDGAVDLALLPGGDVIVAGDTESADFPATAGSPAGGRDVWVSRFDGSFHQRLWTRRIGGGGDDVAAAVALDSSGDVYLAGTTASGDFPAVAAYDASANGGSDVFLVKLDGATGAILFSTYLGGDSDDEARDVAVDAFGRAFVVGTTLSNDFPEAAPIGVGHASRDAFFTRFSAAGSSLEFSSYYSNDGVFGSPFLEDAKAVALDDAGNVYIALFLGDPESGDDYDHNRIVKLSGVSNAIVYDYLFGPGPPDDVDGTIEVSDIAVDFLGRATFAGFTEAQEDLPLVNALQSSPGGERDFFVARLDAAGASLEFSTYLGGEESESDASLALGPDLSIYLAGATTSFDYPLLRPLDHRIAGAEGILTRLSEDGQGFLSSTYFGGSGSDGIAGVAVGADGVALVAGATGSPDLQVAGLLPDGFAPPDFDDDGFAARLAPIGVARFLPLRSVTLAEPAQVADPSLLTEDGGLDLDGDGVPEAVELAEELPLAASTYTSRGADGRDLISIELGTLGGARVAGALDLDRDGENELVVDDPSRPRGSFEGWLLDHRDSDVDLLIRGTGGDQGLLLADLDGDGEVELVVRDPLAADLSFEDLDGGESPADNDADLVFVGGRPRAAVDLDGDGEPEVVAEMLDGGNGSVVALDGVGGNDGDDDVIFVGGDYQLAADLDADQIAELFVGNPDAAPGSVDVQGQIVFLGGTARGVANLDLDPDGENELVADSPGLPPGFSSLSAPGVVFLGGSYLGLADVDDDGEPEVLAISSTQAPGTYSVGIPLEAEADLDPDILFLPPGARGVADVDGDGELEIVADQASLAPGTYTAADGFEAITDGDADVIFLGGQLSLFGDLDGDFETELIVRDATAAGGSVAAQGGAESPADADRDVLFLAGTALLIEDLDGDGESEVAAQDAIAGIATFAGFENPADGDTDVVLSFGVPAGVADLDGDGENELLVADSSVPASSVNSAAALESPADADADVIRVGGVPRLQGDLDGDGEIELVAEAAGQAAGTVVKVSGLESPADGDADVVFVRSGAARLADLDGDLENELLIDDDGSAAAGTALTGASLESPADGDADVIFLGGVLRAVADLDADSEAEALVEAAIAAASASGVELESPADGDPDLVFTGGRARRIGDFDGDGENEAALEASGLTPGTTTLVANLEPVADGDTDLVFTSGVIQTLADYDSDGEIDFATTTEQIAGGTGFHQRNLENPGDADPDVAFLGTGVVSGVRDPNGGETWYIGSTQAIHWDLASPGNVKVQISRDNGATWTNIIGSTPNDGEQLWDVKGPPTFAALVRVTSKDDPGITDTSDGTFNIPPASITLLSPNGGQTFQVGEHVDVVWSSVNLAGGIEVTVSRDGGASWEIIDATTPNDGSKGWTVTGPSTTQAIFRVRSAVEPTIADQGDGTSTINAPSLTVTSPNGGETLLLGSTATLTWSSSGLAGALHIDLSRDGGASWERIVTNTANDGSQAWNVVGAPTSQALVRIKSVSNPAVFDVSDATFTIPPASVTVTSPNGGETLLVGSLVNLQWSSANLGGNVKVELSRDNGGSWETLFATTPNDGIQAWRVVGAPTTQARLRVSSRNEPAIADLSNATFTIPAPSLTLNSPNGGESWAIGTTKAITWSSSNLAGTLDVEISRDGGGSWNPILTNTPNDGSQNWVVSGPATTQALIRIRSSYAPTVEDSSNAVFTIP